MSTLEDLAAMEQDGGAGDPPTAPPAGEQPQGRDDEMADDGVDREIMNASVEEVVNRTRLLDNEIRVSRGRAEAY